MKTFKGLPFGWVDVAWTAAALVWLWGMFNVPTLLGVGTDCMGAHYSRRAEFGEAIVCGMRSGARGWIVAIWYLAPLLPLARFGLALRRRGKGSGKGDEEK